MADLDEITGVSYSGGELWTPNDPNRFALHSERFQTVFTRSHNDDGLHSSKNGVGLEVPQAYGRYTWTGATYLLDTTRSKNMSAVQAGDYTATGGLVLRLSITMNTSSEWGVIVMPLAYYNTTLVGGVTTYQTRMRFAIEDRDYAKTTTTTKIQLFEVSSGVPKVDCTFGVLVFGVRD